MQSSKQNYEKYMRICFELARNAEGKTSPNPMAGAILVDKKGVIVSKGYHKGCGLDHAEVDCIKNYEKLINQQGTAKDYSNLTMYVNLEPCNHFGKTPPCTDLILKKGIKKIVVAVLDPNPEHSGGIKKLEENGVEVVKNILKDEAIKLNEVFFKNVQQKRPFIAMKTATTLDGKIATKNGSSKWITSKTSRNYVQKIRSRYDAILTSSTTVIQDDPSLTVRDEKDNVISRPARIILDTSLKTNPKSKVYNNDGAKVFIIYTFAKENEPVAYPKNVKFIKVPSNEGKINLKIAVQKLFEIGISGILVEAGGTLNGAFLKENLVDKIYQFIAPKIMGDKSGINFTEGFNCTDINKCRNFEITTLKNPGSDIFIELYPSNSQL